MERGFSRIWRIFADSFLRKLGAVERRFYPCKLRAIKRGFNGFSQIYADFVWCVFLSA
ncbi:MAG: hypothetical protein FWG87_07710 [Defluviitaleaceae bacterium]|nr:hypothetical protein [Defluviitaleaceae bacterium]